MEEERIPDVRVTHSEARPMIDRLLVQGQTQAERKVTVRAETDGMVNEVLVEKGAHVAEGELLVQLDMDERQARLQEARAELSRRRLEFQAAERLEQQELQSEAAVAEARAALESALAETAMAALEVERVAITAPIEGTLDSRTVEVGDFVTRGQAVGTIVDLDPIRVVGQVSERYLGQMAEGQPGEARLFGGAAIQGTISYVGAVASEQTHTFPVELQIPNPDGLIIEGITAALSLPVAQSFAHRLPQSALSLNDAGALGVKAVDADNRVVFYEVQILGDSEEGMWLGGLPPELTVITIGGEFVKPGQHVHPVYASAVPG